MLTASCPLMVYSSTTLKFRKVVRQQISGKVIGLNSIFLRSSYLNATVTELLQVALLSQRGRAMRLSVVSFNNINVE